MSSPVDHNRPRLPHVRRDAARIDRSWAIVLVGVGALALFAAIWLFARPLALLLAAITIGEAVSPLVDWLARRIRRELAVALVFLVVFLVVLGIGWIVLPAVINQVQDAAVNGPDLLNATRRWIDRLGVISSTRIEVALQDTLSRFSDAVFTLPLTIASSAFEILAVLFLAVYWLIGKPALRRFTLSLFPSTQRGQVADILAEMGHSMGGYVRGALINAAVIGICDYIGLRVIGVQYPLVLALISASSEPIPVIGPIIGAVPALAVALLDSPTQALIVLAFKVGLQQFEGQLLAPNIMRRQTDVPQLLVLFALLAGTAVGGLLGALVAIPRAGSLKVVVMRIIAPALRRQLATLHGEAPHDVTDRGDAVSEGPSQGDDHVLSHLGRPGTHRGGGRAGLCCARVSLAHFR